MSLIAPDVINDDLLPALLTRDVDRIFAFLTEHAIDQQAVAQLFETLPRMVKALIENHPQIHRRAEDEMWTFQHLATTSDQNNTIQVQMIVAALNDDDETLTALVRAVLAWPDEEVEVALAGLMTTFIQIVESWPVDR